MASRHVRPRSRPRAARARSGATGTGTVSASGISSRNQRNQTGLRPVILAAVEDYTAMPRRRREQVNLVERFDVEEISLDTSCDPIDLTKEHDGTIVDLTVTSPSPPINTSPQRRRNRNRYRMDSVEILEPQRELQIETVIDDLDLPQLATGFIHKAKENKDQSPSDNPTTSTSDNVAVTNAPTWTCPICFDSLQQLQQGNISRYSTVCGHVFCQPCIHDSVKNMRKCPACRKKLTLKQIHPIFI